MSSPNRLVYFSSIYLLHWFFFLLFFYPSTPFFFFFFFNDTAPTEIYPLPLHDALPICDFHPRACAGIACLATPRQPRRRSEEHTSELQSHLNLVCRLLLEKKKKV